MGRRRHRNRKPRQAPNNSRNQDGYPHDGGSQQHYAPRFDRNTIWLTYFLRTRPGDEAFRQEFGKTYSSSMKWSLAMFFALFAFSNRMDAPDAMELSNPYSFEWTHQILNWLLIIPRNETYTIRAPQFLRISAGLCLANFSLAVLAWFSFGLYMGHYGVLQGQITKSLAAHARDHFECFYWMKSWYILTIISYLPVVTALAGWFLITGLIMSYSFGRLLTFLVLAVVIFLAIGVFYEVDERRVRLQAISEAHHAYLSMAAIVTQKNYMDAFGA